MRRVLKILIVLPVLLVVALTFAGLMESDAYWIRMTDFPRLQYLVALAVLGLLVLVLRPLGNRLRLLLGLLILPALAFNAVKLRYYLPAEIRTESCPADRRFDVMVANVKLGNREIGELVQTVREREPDVFLAMETDEWWDEQLSVLEDEMPHTMQEITGSYFGMHLFSRLPIESGEMVFPVGQDAPAVSALIDLPSGEALRFLGVHPRPPHPGQPSIGRDAQLIWAGLQAHEAERPVVIGGDLNAVPWESTMHRMRALGGLLDPRLERGFLPSFDARSAWMLWPLDQLLHGPELTAVSLERREAFGSDHFPVAGSFCLRPSDKEPPELTEEMVRDARETLTAARQQSSDAPEN